MLCIQYTCTLYSVFIADRGHAMSAQRDTTEGRAADSSSSRSAGRPYLACKQRLEHLEHCDRRASVAGKTAMETKPGYSTDC